MLVEIECRGKREVIRVSQEITRSFKKLVLVQSRNEREIREKIGKKTLNEF